MFMKRINVGWMNERKERYVESVHSRVLSEWIRIINIPIGLHKEFDKMLEGILTNLREEKRNTPVTDEDGVRGMPCENEEFLHQFTPTGMPKYNLRLKVEAIIMLIKNLDISEVMNQQERSKRYIESVHSRVMNEYDAEINNDYYPLTWPCLAGICRRQFPRFARP
ncbi:hypothetical protein ANCCEY_09125 [Ancylostoma ceylanicum]|uniref:DNA helicase Pif1-like 2B domain-containing protein n=1 Tax=Ancylostoma ceylanicum TaxID=53326 RepID=A0A0D6LIC4_9BILA|nr:hypothetical protein ANCCEY_09125 [Ancylostoma ceylanicum]